MTTSVSVVIPAFREGRAILPTLDRVLQTVPVEAEVLVVVDSPKDSTLPPVLDVAAGDRRVRAVVNTYGRGPANAIRFGIDEAAFPVVVVTMADGSDDASQIVLLADLVQGGAVVACASRYAAGGQQVGGPLLKSLLSRAAGRSLNLVARVGTHDATNSYKAYSTAFVKAVGIESRNGFEIGIELTAKARRLRLPVAEVPTVWRDRAEGRSSFRLWAWLPHYLRWYSFAFGPPLTLRQLQAVASATVPPTTGRTVSP